MSLNTKGPNLMQQQAQSSRSCGQGLCGQRAKGLAEVEYKSEGMVINILASLNALKQLRQTQ